MPYKLDFESPLAVDMRGNSPSIHSSVRWFICCHGILAAGIDVPNIGCDDPTQVSGDGEAI